MCICVVDERTATNFGGSLDFGGRRGASQSGQKTKFKFNMDFNFFRTGVA